MYDLLKCFYKPEEFLLLDPIFLLTNRLFVPLEWQQNGEHQKLSIADIINEGSELYRERNFFVDLDGVYLDSKYKRKFLTIKNKTIDYEGQNCSMLLIQDVTAFYVVDKEIKNTEDLIQTNVVISRQIKKPLRMIKNVTQNLIDLINSKKS